MCSIPTPDGSKMTTRRTLLKSTTAAGLMAFPLARIGRAAKPNSKVQHASIGVGGMGWGDVNQFASHPNAEIVAICDVDTRRLAAAAKKFPNARKYQDWRQLLEKEGDKVDSVNVTTPDHMHAPITMTALGMGKHVYCQKPLTHDVYQARQIAAAAKRAAVVTQMGIQLSSSVGARMSVEMLRKGAIGKVKEVFLWSNKSPGKYRPVGPRPKKTDPVPGELDWDAWCGTAPVRPYVRGVYHPSWWRGWLDFGCGWLGDMGCHIMDMPYRALGLGMPIAVKAQVEPKWRDDPARRVETFPTWQIVRYTYAGTDLTAGKTVDITWSDGFKYPPAEFQKNLLEGRKYPAQGALLIGEEGVMLMPHGSGPILYPSEKLKGVARPKPKPQNHYRQFIDAILGKNGGKTQASFNYAGPLSEMVLLGTVALQFPDKTLKWDASNMKVTNIKGAERYIRQACRKEWRVKGL
ncbi:MAG: Gfo/Idh/MocA family oxidoreductase [Phycisphaerae bacterium]|jgi:predicted dehydrogenase|nr:Gfo/Idh/MocA family oxidoreductase [Phycisphaerae bacterium]